MIRIDARPAVKSLKELMAKLSPQQIARAQTSAINRTIAMVKTGAGREIRSVYAIKASGMMKRLPIKLATASKPSASMSAEKRPLPLKEFAPRQTKKGVSITILKGQRKLVKSAFIQNVGGSQGIYARGRYQKGNKYDDFNFRKKRESPTGPDLVINQLRSLSLVAAVMHDSVEARIRQDVDSNLGPRLVHEMQRLINKSASLL